jgi:protein-L-isoaspartate O-methyltransferase
MPGLRRDGDGVIERYKFIPETIWVDGDDGWMAALHRADDPDGWMAVCRSDDPIVTQVDDGRPAGGKGIRPSSSSTAPSMMRAMIEKLDLVSGLKVLEIGTGTGYNAAMIAEIVGPDHVVTIEVDPAVADHARKALSGAGCRVTSVVGDGVLGYPVRAPYDRVMATAAVREIPYSWIEQTCRNGRVLVPWTSSFSSSGALVALTVRAGGTADGRFGDPAAFMYLRAQRLEPVPWLDDELSGDYIETKTRFALSSDVFLGDPDTGFVMGIKLPGVVPGKTIGKNGASALRLSHSASGSWASFTAGSSQHVVRQHGPRRLWDEFESAYQWWAGLDRPKPERFGITVTSEGQIIWIDSPDKVVST